MGGRGLYLLVLAVKIARAGAVEEGQATGRPLGFLQAAGFQWINPKAWIIVISACATYTIPDHYASTVMVVALVFGAVTFPSRVGLGAVRRRAPPSPRNSRMLRLFNWSMAALLVASLYPALRD